MKKELEKFYITTTLPYVNSDPHIGFAMEIVRADVIARYKKAQGYDVFFNTGTDEHGAKIYENAIKAGISLQEYVDGYAKKFCELSVLLNIEGVHFIRTTDKKHIEAAKKIWKKCHANDDIYKKQYKMKYCVGCELEKTDSELIDGKCQLHPNREIELHEEENYFFRWSKYQKPLLDLYKAHPDFVIPSFRFNEIKAFVSRGLEDFSISRLKSKMPWGVAVPGDETQVMYVWFDALTSYISTLGFGTDEKDFSYWLEGTPVQYCGKDNLRQQSAMWQAMLMSANLPNSAHIVIDGFITSGGKKMSKSVGNVINPFEVIDLFRDVTEYPEEVLRFVLLHSISSFEDGDITIESIKMSYTAYLANGIGNLTSRIMKMATSYEVKIKNRKDFSFNAENDKIWQNYEKCILNFDLKGSMDSIFHAVTSIDFLIQQEEPFKLIKTDPESAKKIVEICLEDLYIITEKLNIFMPRTSEKILECIRENKMPEKPLFNRLA